MNCVAERRQFSISSSVDRYQQNLQTGEDFNWLFIAKVAQRHDFEFGIDWRLSTVCHWSRMHVMIVQYTMCSGVKCCALTAVEGISLQYKQVEFMKVLQSMGPIQIIVIPSQNMETEKTKEFVASLERPDIECAITDSVSSEVSTIGFDPKTNRILAKEYNGDHVQILSTHGF